MIQCIGRQQFTYFGGILSHPGEDIFSLEITDFISSLTICGIRKASSVVSIQDNGSVWDLTNCFSNMLPTLMKYLLNASVIMLFSIVIFHQL